MNAESMAGQVLLTISRDEVECARLLSEYKYIVDTQSKVVQAKREGRVEREAEILAFLNQGGTLEELKQRLATDARQSTAQVSKLWRGTR
jgi:hypothetical protein